MGHLTSRQRDRGPRRPTTCRWSEADCAALEETEPAGQCSSPAGDVLVVHKFGSGVWERDVQSGVHFERPYHEVAYIIEGEVEITDEDGEVLWPARATSSSRPGAARGTGRT